MLILPEKWNHQKLVDKGSSCISVLQTMECEVTPGHPREEKFMIVLETWD